MIMIEKMVDDFGRTHLMERDRDTLRPLTRDEQEKFNAILSNHGLTIQQTIRVYNLAKQLVRRFIPLAAKAIKMGEVPENVHH
jgi:hypothetical protein